MNKIRSYTAKFEKTMADGSNKRRCLDEFDEQK
jgi:hypothetical protein